MPKTVSKEALVSLFRTLKDNIRVVLLNACFSKPQAKAITSEIDYAIGMSRAISDAAAIVFAASFYRAIGFGRTIKEAFDQGKTALLLESIPEGSTPKLLIREGIAPNQIELVSESILADIASAILESHREMPEENYLLSSNQRYKLLMKGDGNLVIYEDRFSVVWATNTDGQGRPPFKLAMQSDGNLVIYDGTGRPTWATDTCDKGRGPFRLIMQDDRNLVIYDAQNRPTWASNTVR
jgi:hypothetical protein